MYKKSIVLIGPSGAGKTSVAEEISKDTGLRRFSIDSITKNDGPSGFISRFESLDDYNLAMTKAFIERAETGDVSGVIDFGAGHTFYEDPKKLEEAKKIFSRFKNVIFLCPSCNITESLDIMEETSKGDTSNNKKYLTSRCYRELSNMTVYWNGRGPKTIAKDIIRFIDTRDKEMKELGRD